jgi:AcrR family transcriptional regulator
VTEEDDAVGRAPRRPRGLSREDIVVTAIAIADAEGTAAVSMRRIARDLDVGAMSLYWYVESKEELHRLMLEGVHGEIEAAEPSGDWRGDLAGYARNYRAALHRHPWAIDFLGVGPPSGPNDARNADRLLGALDGLGLDAATTIWALLTVGTYVMGAALREIQEIRWHRAADEAKAEMTEAEVAAARQGFERMIRGSGRYPHIAKIFDADVDPDAPETRDARFEFGLSCVLDGIAALVSALLPAQMHEDATEVLGVLLDPDVLSGRRVLLEEAQHVLLELARPLTRDDLDQRRLLRLGLVEDAVQRLFDLRTPVVDVVQVERQLHLPRLCAGLAMRPDGGDDLVGGLRGVALGQHRHDPFTTRGRLEGGKLAIEQLLGEEMVMPRQQPPLQFLPADHQEDHGRLSPCAQFLAVGALERRAGHHGGVAVRDLAIHPVADGAQPRRAVGVGERDTRAHLGDVGFRVKSVRVREPPAEPPGDQRADRRLAAARYPRHDEDHGYHPTRPPQRQQPQRQ